MARPKSPVPSYLFHKRTGQARVRLRCGTRYRDVYLGKYGAAESLEKYHRVLAEHFNRAATGEERSVFPVDEGHWTIATLAVKYDDFASTHYVKNGEATDDRYRAAIPPLVHLYGATLALEFGPKRLKALREYVIQRGNLRTAHLDAQGNIVKSGESLSREYVNNLIKSVVRMFKWAVTEEKVPASVPDALAAVGGLRRGRDPRIREPKAIKPVSEEHFWPVVEASSLQIAAMLQIQRLTGMRPDEVTIMRPCDLDRQGQVWVYRPDSHKLEWLDQEKLVLLGPRAQKLILPWLDRRQPTEYLFSPREAAEANALELEKRRKRRSTKRVPISEVRPPREHYDDRAYRQAVQRACGSTYVVPWPVAA